jgi:F0F1-type ATP synthase assembly protein I
MKDKRNDAYTMLGRYLGLTTLLPATTFVGYAIGYLLDKAFGTTYLRIVFLLFGIAGGIVELIRELSKDSGER